MLLWLFRYIIIIILIFILILMRTIKFKGVVHIVLKEVSEGSNSLVVVAVVVSFTVLEVAKRQIFTDTKWNVHTLHHLPF